GEHDLPRGAQVRGAAQRLRLLEVPLRSGGAAPPSRGGLADRGVPLLQRLRAERMAQGAHGLGRLALLQPVPRARQGAPLRPVVGSGGYADGEQQRDFVSVEDVSRVNLYFLDHPELSGIFNLGTGKAQSFNDVALATINACRRAKGEKLVTLEEAQKQGLIEYAPFPDALKGKYQNYTQPDIR